jgi:hypothetical protein
LWLWYTAATGPLIAQMIGVSWMILSDSRQKPLIPHIVAWLNLIFPLCLIPISAAHCAHGGVMAWDGAVSFWLPWVVAVVPFAMFYYYLWKAAGTLEELKVE